MGEKVKTLVFSRLTSKRPKSRKNERRFLARTAENVK